MPCSVGHPVCKHFPSSNLKVFSVHAPRYKSNLIIKYKWTRSIPCIFFLFHGISFYSTNLMSFYINPFFSTYFLSILLIPFLFHLSLFFSTYLLSISHIPFLFYWSPSYSTYPLSFPLISFLFHLSPVYSTYPLPIPRIPFLFHWYPF